MSVKVGDHQNQQIIKEPYVNMNRAVNPHFWQGDSLFLRQSLCLPISREIFLFLKIISSNIKVHASVMRKK